MSSTVSLVQVVNDIITKNINSEKALTVQKILYFKAGTTLTPVVITQVSF